MYNLDHYAHFAAATVELNAEFFGVVAAIIIPALGIVFGFGKAFEKISNNTKSIEDLDKGRMAIVTRLDKISDKLSKLTGQVQQFLNSEIGDDLAVANSPKKLSAVGQKVLADSGIEGIIEPRFEQIVDAVKAQKPENSYQAQESVFEVVYDLINDADLKNEIEEGAFQSGHTPIQVLYVGALNIRDRVMEQLHMEVADIDKHDPKVVKGEG